jgi:fermentation-respiration switch protein FrsA (DUF1100 family)
MQNVTSPVFILHGLRDTLIPPSHARALIAQCQAAAYCVLSTPENMDHVVFDFYQDFTHPLKQFLKRSGYFPQHLMNSNTTAKNFFGNNFN